eukprot:jgi/Ulvmu1/5016/UM021_0033.1
MVHCLQVASPKPRARCPARSVRAQPILAQAQSHGPRSNISAPHQRGSRQRMAWSVADGRVAPVPQAKKEKKPLKQTITVAVDGTEDSVQGLQWVLDNFADTGSKLNLVHVINNDRVFHETLSADDGLTLTISYDEHYQMEYIDDYADRKAEQAKLMISKMYLDIVEDAGMDYGVQIAVVKGQRSAAAFADAIVRRAKALNTDLLAISSHGSGMGCSYGSVARHCVQNFDRAIALLPPDVGSYANLGSSTVCFGINSLSELEDSMNWALKNFCRAGDSVSVLRAVEESVDTIAGSDQTSIMLGLQGQVMKHHVDDLSFDLIQPDFENATETIDVGDGVEEPYRNQVTAHEVIRVAEDVKKGRALVMTNYANRGFMQEMMFGTLAMLVSRKAPMPLLLIPPNYSFE